MRHSQGITQPPGSGPVELKYVGVSAGTAAVIGLRYVRQADAPSTAYLLVGRRCILDCGFCTQARHSTARSGFLSRVSWPMYAVNEAIGAVAHAFSARHIERCCFQVTVFPGHFAQALRLVRSLRACSRVPICVSIVLSRLEEVRELLSCGAERVTLALDAACEKAYRAAKGRDWRQRLEFLKTAARCFPDRIGTHLIVGLGESEQEMSAILQEMVDRRISVGLFAFTPVPGTAWERCSPPSLSAYRRIQVGFALLAARACRVDEFRFTQSGRIASYGMSLPALRLWLADGRAFQTRGCPGCNRPCYNERPGRAMYNYPRPLNEEEAKAAISAATAELVSAEIPRRIECYSPNGA